MSDFVERVGARVRRTRTAQPAFTLLLGAGFSFPLIPTASQILQDASWWLFRKSRKVDGPEERPQSNSELEVFERHLWSRIQEASQAAFPLDEKGLPQFLDSNTTAELYKALMSGRSAEGLSDPQLRRQYLRETGARPGRKVNWAHLFLASILRAQGTPAWSAKGNASPFCRTIFTTNFDPLLQRSLQLFNTLYYMTDRPEALEAPLDDDHDAIHLVYAHGSVHRYLLLNTEEEIRRARETNAQALVPYFERHGVIVIGYGGWPDAVMDALRRCRSFDGNLYWCDIHGPDAAASRLSPEVVDFLREKRGVAFYVAIDGADELLLALHAGLGLGETPPLILDPINEVMEDLRSLAIRSAVLEVSDDPDPIARLGLQVSRTLSMLEAARAAFLDPQAARGRPKSQAAVVARRMNEAWSASQGDQPDRAIALWSSVIDDPASPIEERATALLNRGVTFGEREDSRELEDYAAVLRLPNAPPDVRALAHLARGVAWSIRGRVKRELADYDALIALADAPGELKAQALVYRGMVRAEQGRLDEAIADYSSALEQPGAHAEERAQALLNRGAAFDEKGKPKEALRDWEAVLALRRAPNELRATALANRARARQQAGDREAALKDYDRILEMRGLPGEERAEAFAYRGWLRYEGGDDEGLVEDSEAALAALDAAAEETRASFRWVRFNLALGSFLLGDTPRAIEEYRRAAKQCDTPQELREEGIADLKRALQLRGLQDSAGVLKILKDRERELLASRRTVRKSRPGGRGTRK